MSLTKRVREEQQLISRSESHSGRYEDYEFTLHMSENRRFISVLRFNDHSYLRLGIIEFTPKSVSDIEAFAEKASDLFRTIAKELREAGFDDLRDEWDKRHDEIEASMLEIRAQPNEHDKSQKRTQK